MVTLKHAIKISAPKNQVYQALTDIDAMRSWHLGSIEGAIAPGKVMLLLPGSGQRFGWRTDVLEPDKFIEQTEVEGPGDSVGRILTFVLSELPENRTQVVLTHGDWKEDDDHLAFCNTHWGEVLYRLKSHVEKG
ncbi:SRPBCC domain-containing protein [Klebsiella quasipneumoniae]|uniref:SRPBCC domain-containing protein n=1 Tax=Klebsiella quasipneumoniae TaxID=1463165 RepID=UPI003DA10814